jgi:hypothetical protein
MLPVCATEASIRGHHFAGRIKGKKASTIMGQVIARKAGTDRILGAFAKTWSQAEARGGDVKAMAETRLGDLNKLVGDIEQQYNQARDVDEQHGVTPTPKPAPSPTANHMPAQQSTAVASRGGDTLPVQ